MTDTGCSNLFCLLARELLGDAWENIGLDVTDFGTIIELRWAWTDPTASVGVPITELFKKLLQPWRSTHAIMVLKAFPLEYDGYCSFDDSDGLNFDIVFHRRRRALVRMFERVGFEPFPGKPGADGWMLRVPDRLKSVVTRPGKGWLKSVMR